MNELTDHYNGIIAGLRAENEKYMKREARLIWQVARMRETLEWYAKGKDGYVARAVLEDTK